MLDPLSALSLACGIIQVVDFGCKVVSHGKELYERGSLARNDDVEYLTESLRSLNIQILSQGTHVSVQSPEYQTLMDLATKCSQTASSLLKELGKLKIVNPQNRWETWVQKPVAAIWKKGKLDKLKSDLESFQQTLDSKILSMLRRDVESLVQEQRDSFSQMDERVRNLVTAFIEQSCSLRDLAQIFNQGNQITQQCIEDGFKQLEVKSLDSKRQQDFLDSLYFPEIYQRQEQIKDAHRDTFKWIFDESGVHIRPWSSVIDWLKYGSDTYWISGKPGSGKSTLMNFVHQDKRTEDSLKVWAGSKKLLCPSFFFWAAGGNPVQKTIPGLLRSLIYQMLKASPDLFASIAIPESEIVWTEKKLIKYMREILQRAAVTHRICFFIDGLDELSGDHYELVRLIRALGNKTTVKFCVASRPEKPFEFLASASMLCLQDLTRPDIQNFVQAELGELVQIKRLPPEDRGRKQKIFDEVVERADGVFLWVHLAVKTQVIGISVDDTFEMLEQRLLSLPEKIQDLYSDMLRRIDPFHHKEVAKYIRVVLARRDTSIFDCTVATCYLTNELDLESSRIESGAFVRKCMFVHQRILAICAGFLEVKDLEDITYYDVIQGWLAWEQDKSIKSNFPTNWMKTSVSFFHRTALDYFKENESEGVQFLMRNSSELSPEILGMATPLAKMRLCNLANPARFMAHVIYDSLTDRLALRTQMAPRFAASFDRIVDQLDKEHNSKAEKAHWCTRWGPLAAFKGSFEAGPWAERLESEIENQDHIPKDFWTLAACYKRYDLVSTYLEQFGSIIEAEQLTRLIICTLGSFYYEDSYHLGHVWVLRSWEQVHTLSELIQHGSNLNTRLRDVVWEMVLGFGYWETLDPYYIGNDPMSHKSSRKDLCKIFATFLKTGVELGPVIRIQIEFLGSSGCAEVDTTLAPLVRPLFEEQGRLSELQRFDALQQHKTRGTAERIWFGKGAEKCVPSDGYLMTPEESHSLHENINKTMFYLIRNDETKQRRYARELVAVIERMMRKSEYGEEKDDEEMTSPPQIGRSNEAEDERLGEPESNGLRQLENL